MKEKATHRNHLGGRRLYSLVFIASMFALNVCLMLQETLSLRSFNDFVTDAIIGDSSSSGITSTALISITTSISGTSIRYLAPARMKHWKGLVIGVLSAAKSPENRNMIRKTWGAGSNVLFVVAGPFASIEEEIDVFDDLLWIDLEEKYFGIETILPFKTQTFFHAVHSFVKECDYVLKTDDDSVVNTPKLASIISSESFDYWGHVFQNIAVIRDERNKWFVPANIYQPDKYPDYCSGAGYLLSKKFLTCAVPVLPYLHFMPREDVATGLLAQTCGIKPKAAGSNAIHFNRVGPVESLIIRHYVKSLDDMSQLWIYLSRNSSSVRYLEEATNSTSGK